MSDDAIDVTVDPFNASVDIIGEDGNNKNISMSVDNMNNDTNSVNDEASFDNEDAASMGSSSMESIVMSPPIVGVRANDDTREERTAVLDLENSNDRPEISVAADIVSDMIAAVDTSENVTISDHISEPTGGNTNTLLEVAIQESRFVKTIPDTESAPVVSSEFLELSTVNTMAQSNCHVNAVDTSPIKSISATDFVENNLIEDSSSQAPQSSTVPDLAIPELSSSAPGILRIIPRLFECDDKEVLGGGKGHGIASITLPVLIEGSNAPDNSKYHSVGNTSCIVSGLPDITVASSIREVITIVIRFVDWPSSLSTSQRATWANYFSDIESQIALVLGVMPYAVTVRSVKEASHILNISISSDCANLRGDLSARQACQRFRRFIESTSIPGVVIEDVSYSFDRDFGLVVDETELAVASSGLRRAILDLLRPTMSMNLINCRRNVLRMWGARKAGIVYDDLRLFFLQHLKESQSLETKHITGHMDSINHLVAARLRSSSTLKTELQRERDAKFETEKLTILQRSGRSSSVASIEEAFLDKRRRELQQRQASLLEDNQGMEAQASQAHETLRRTIQNAASNSRNRLKQTFTKEIERRDSRITLLADAVRVSVDGTIHELSRRGKIESDALLRHRTVIEAEFQRRIKERQQLMTVLLATRQDTIARWHQARDTELVLREADTDKAIAEYASIMEKRYLDGEQNLKHDFEVMLATRTRSYGVMTQTKRDQLNDLVQRLEVSDATMRSQSRNNIAAAEIRQQNLLEEIRQKFEEETSQDIKLINGLIAETNVVDKIDEITAAAAAEERLTLFNRERELVISQLVIHQERQEQSLEEMDVIAKVHVTEEHAHALARQQTRYEDGLEKLKIMMTRWEEELAANNKRRVQRRESEVSLLQRLEDDWIAAKQRSETVVSARIASTDVRDREARDSFDLREKQLLQEKEKSIIDIESTHTRNLESMRTIRDSQRKTLQQELDAALLARDKEIIDAKQRLADAESAVASLQKRSGDQANLLREKEETLMLQLERFVAERVLRSDSILCERVVEEDTRWQVREDQFSVKEDRAEKHRPQIDDHYSHIHKRHIYVDRTHRHSILDLLTMNSYQLNHKCGLMCILSSSDEAVLERQHVRLGELLSHVGDRIESHNYSCREKYDADIRTVVDDVRNEMLINPRSLSSKDDENSRESSLQRQYEIERAVTFAEAELEAVRVANDSVDSNVSTLVEMRGKYHRDRDNWIEERIRARYLLHIDIMQSSLSIVNATKSLAANEFITTIQTDSKDFVENENHRIMSLKRRLAFWFEREVSAWQHQQSVTVSQLDNKLATTLSDLGRKRHQWQQRLKRTKLSARLAKHDYIQWLSGDGSALQELLSEIRSLQSIASYFHKLKSDVSILEDEQERIYDLLFGANTYVISHDPIDDTDEGIKSENNANSISKELHMQQIKDIVKLWKDEEFAPGVGDKILSSRIQLLLQSMPLSSPTDELMLFMEDEVHRLADRLPVMEMVAALEVMRCRYERAKQGGTSDVNSSSLSEIMQDWQSLTGSFYSTVSSYQHRHQEQLLLRGKPIELVAKEERLLSIG